MSAHKRHLLFYYQNCGGLRSKVNEVRTNILNSNYDVIILTETWFRPGVYDSELFDGRYTVLRRDRDSKTSVKKDGGGVLVATKKTLSATRRADWEDRSIEELYVSLPIINSYIILCATYIPPASPHDLYVKHLTKLQTIYSRHPVYTYCVIGDYNLPNMSNMWKKFPVTSNAHIQSDTHKLFLDTTALLGLNQHNVITNDNGRVLDLLLTNIDCDIKTPDVVLSKIDRHHPPFQYCFQAAPEPTIPRIEIPKYDFYKANYVTICNQLNATDWSLELAAPTAEAAVDRFYDHLYDIIDNNVPLKQKRSPKYPLWFSQTLKSALNRKLKVWRKWKTYNSQADYAEFSLLRTRCKHLMTDCFRKYVESTENLIPKNIKSFWKYVSSLKKSDTDYPNTMHLADMYSDKPEEIAELFSGFFSSVFEPSSDILNIHLNDLPVSESAPCIPGLQLESTTIKKYLNSLDTKKGPGPDKITPFFLKHTRDAISWPLSIIFNRCMIDGIFPTRWKLAYVVPLHKSGPKNSVPNYRPISLLSAIPKVFESIIQNSVYSSLSEHLLANQHGFMKRKSTVTNLLVYSDYLFNSMDKRTQVDAIYTDFRKAFDKVDHLLLIQKLAYNGITGSLLEWFRSYLSGRYQIITINGHTSSQSPVSSGVVQGSILGPLQYILFINDMDSCFQNCEYLMFADDLKIYRQIHSQADCLLVQSDLDRFSAYCLQNKLYLAHDKCLQISFTKNKNKILYNYEIGGHVLNKVTEVRDLGVTLDEKLTFDKHIDKICTKAYRMLGFVLRTTKPFKKASTFLTLYKTFVRSQLDYASTIWNPHYAVYTNQIEMVQKKFLRAMHYRLTRSKLSYVDLLKTYNLTSLTDRRTITDSIILHNICNNYYNCPQLIRKINFRVPSLRTRSKHLFSVPSCLTNAGKRTPLHRICSKHNDEHLSVDLFSNSRVQFKKLILNLIVENQTSQVRNT